MSQIVRTEDNLYVANGSFREGDKYVARLETYTGCGGRKAAHLATFAAQNWANGEGDDRPRYELKTLDRGEFSPWEGPMITLDQEAATALVDRLVEHFDLPFVNAVKLEAPPEPEAGAGVVDDNGLHINLMYGDTFRLNIAARDAYLLLTEPNLGSQNSQIAMFLSEENLKALMQALVDRDEDVEVKNDFNREMSFDFDIAGEVGMTVAKVGRAQEWSDPDTEVIEVWFAEDQVDALLRFIAENLGVPVPNPSTTLSLGGSSIKVTDEQVAEINKIIAANKAYNSTTVNF